MSGERECVCVYLKYVLYRICEVIVWDVRKVLLISIFNGKILIILSLFI